MWGEGVSSFFIPYNVLREMGSPMMLLKMISMTSNVFLLSRAHSCESACVIVCADCRFFYKKG